MKDRKKPSAAKAAPHTKAAPAAPSPAVPQTPPAAPVDTAVFDRRLARHHDELKWLYCELYHGDLAAFDYFLAMLRRSWASRKADLRAQDQHREADPDWYRRRDLLGMMLYNVTTMATTWHTLATADVSLLRHQMDAVCALPRDFLFLNYLRCHDDIGWGLDYPWLKEHFGTDEVAHKKYLNDYFTGRWPSSDSRGELYNDAPPLGDARLCGTTASLCGVEAADYERDPFKLERAIACDLMLHAWMLTQSGIPVLYSGDEVGQLNDYSYHLDDEKREDSRYLHRGAFQWDLAAMRRDPDTRQGKQFMGLRRLEELRCAEPAFDARADVWTFDTGSAHVLGVGRWYQGRKLIAMFNFSNQFLTASCREEGPFEELIYGGRFGDLSHVELPPYGFVWLLHTDA